MEITWYGLGCFRIMERGYPAVVTDPFQEEETGLSLPRARADIVTYSVPLADPSQARWKGLRGSYRTIASPGEYEIGGLFITGVSSYRDQNKGADRGQNVIYAYNIAGTVVCHLGELGMPPAQSKIEALGTVNVLLLPVGVPDGLTPSMASDVVSLLEPNIVIPMNYELPGLVIPRDPVSRFLKEMGMEMATTEPSFKISGNEFPEETQVVLLECQSK